MIKIKNYLVFISLLSSHSLFAIKMNLFNKKLDSSTPKVIEVAKSENNQPVALNTESTQGLPEDIKNRVKEAKFTPYIHMEQADQIIVQYLPIDSYKRNGFYASNYTKAAGSNKNLNYLIYWNLAGDLYYFSWREKFYKELKGFEKKLADYYHASKSSAIEFLYPGENHRVDPWAIKVNGTMHTTIWVHAKTVDKEKNQKLSKFFDVKPKDINKQMYLLMNESNHIIAKRIDHKYKFMK